MESHPDNGDRAPIAALDPGWLFVLAGLLLTGAVVLIPASNELAEVRVQRDRALALEDHKEARRKSYQDYLDALKREEPALVIALAASQLNQIPKGRSPILDSTQMVTLGGASGDASVFGALEPAPPRLPERQKVDSLLERWTGSDTLRPILIAGAALSLFVGLLPPATRRRPRPETGPLPA